MVVDSSTIRKVWVVELDDNCEMPRPRTYDKDNMKGERNRLCQVLSELRERLELVEALLAAGEATNASCASAAAEPTRERSDWIGKRVRIV